MEHAQRGESDEYLTDKEERGLNPYFNGTCSKSLKRLGVACGSMKSLNPYFNGTCSKSSRKRALTLQDSSVLILILMEHAQRGY